MEIGKYNTLEVVKEVDFGVYLDGGEGREILLPAKYVPDETKIGDKIDVFVYNDSSDRLIATTERPFAMVGEFAFLQVSQVNRVGAFLDWGITAKDLLVPFAQQRVRMHQGGIYLVYVYLDDATKRIVATAKIEKYLGNVIPDYNPGDPVKALVIEKTDIGYKVIVDNLHRGMIYHSDLTHPLELEETVDAHVKAVRPDGKIDLQLAVKVTERIFPLADKIEADASRNGGFPVLDDSATPEQIRHAYGCSKKDYKRALGHLYKERKIKKP